VNGHGYEKVILVSPASTSFTPPTGWVDDSSIIEEMFQK
jgi:hypothetical protein